MVLNFIGHGWYYWVGVVGTGGGVLLESKARQSLGSRLGCVIAVRLVKYSP